MADTPAQAVPDTGRTCGVPNVLLTDAAAQAPRKES